MDDSHELDEVDVREFLRGLDVPDFIKELLNDSLPNGATFADMRNETSRLRLEAAAMHKKAADLEAERKAS